MPSRTDIVEGRVFIKTRHTISGCDVNSEEYVETPIGARRSLDRFKSWSLTPDFFTKRRQKVILPDLPFSFREEVRSISANLISSRVVLEPGIVDGQPCYKHHTFWESIPWCVMVGPSDYGELDSAASLKFKALRKAKMTQFNLPVFLAEMHKTSEMVVARATHLVKLIRALRRGDIDFFLRNLKVSVPSGKGRAVRSAFNKDFGRDARRAAANVWLEMTYGWSPFIKDVHDAVIATMDTSEQERHSLSKVRARTEARLDTRSRVTIQVSPNHSALLRRRVVEERRITWRFGIKPEDIPGRFGLLNPLEVAWELVPFSFVADWFLPVGDYLASVDVPLRFEHKGGTIGLKRTTYDTYSDVRSSDKWSPSGGTSCKYLTVSREPLTGSPIPGFSEFDASFDIGVKRAISAISLLSQNSKFFRR